jgi:hypothetical protein
MCCGSRAVRELLGITIEFPADLSNGLRHEVQRMRSRGVPSPASKIDQPHPDHVDRGCRTDVDTGAERVRVNPHAPIDASLNGTIRRFGAEGGVSVSGRERPPYLTKLKTPPPRRSPVAIAGAAGRFVAHDREFAISPA